MPTELPTYLSLENGFATFRPQGEFTFDQAVDLIDQALGYCMNNNIRGLLADVTEMTGFPPPTTIERFNFATKWAGTASGKVILSMIARPEMIDTDKIGVTMAGNRGLRCEVFTTDTDATDWLVSEFGS